MRARFGELLSLLSVWIEPLALANRCGFDEATAEENLVALATILPPPEPNFLQA